MKGKGKDLNKIATESLGIDMIACVGEILIRKRIKRMRLRKLTNFQTVWLILIGVEKIYKKGERTKIFPSIKVIYLYH